MWVPVSRRSQGRKAGPSLTKKKVRTSTSTAVTTVEVTADTPVNTPAAIWLALPCSRSMTAAVMVSMRSLARFTGGPVASHRRRRLLLPWRRSLRGAGGAVAVDRGLGGDGDRWLPVRHLLDE